MAVIRTAKELAAAVLGDELGILLNNEDPSGADEAFALRKYATQLEKLVDEHVAYWPADEIPGAVFDDLAKIVATECAASFGIPYDKREAGMFALRRHIAQRASSKPTEIMSF